MNLSEYMKATPDERRAVKAALSRRADNAERRVRRLVEADIAGAVRARYPDAVKVRVSLDLGDDVSCMAVGIYGPRGKRLTLEDYWRSPQLDRTVANLAEEAWGLGGGDDWEYIVDGDYEEYPDEDVYEIRLPRG